MDKFIRVSDGAIVAGNSLEANVEYVPCDCNAPKIVEKKEVEEVKVEEESVVKKAIKRVSRKKKNA